MLIPIKVLKPALVVGAERARTQTTIKHHIHRLAFLLLDIYLVLLQLLQLLVGAVHGDNAETREVMLQERLQIGEDGLVRPVRARVIVYDELIIRRVERWCVVGRVVWFCFFGLRWLGWFR